MSESVSFRHNWKHVEAFEYYDQRRGLVQEALQTQIAGVLADNFSTKDTLVEIGAGDGAMQFYAGPAVNSYNWITTEQNQEFLTKLRSPTDLRVATTSGSLPFANESVEGIIGLSMLDTLSADDLERTAVSAYEVLKPGGKVVHILDMSPDLMSEIENAQANGEFPIPYNDTPASPVGLLFVRTKNKHLFAKIQDLPEPEEVRNSLCNLIKYPETVTRLANSTNLLPYLGSVLVKYGLAARFIPDWWEYFGTHLEEAFSASGFAVTQNDMIGTKVIQSSSNLPPHLRQVVNYIRRDRGVVSLGVTDLPVLPGKTMVEADVHVFVAEKPA